MQKWGSLCLARFRTELVLMPADRHESEPYQNMCNMYGA